MLEWRRGTATAAAFDANVRPHQLFLTGDQIYADDVSTVMLPMLNRLGNALIGGPELLPTRYPPKDDDASRERYVNAPKQSGFATLQAFVDDRKAKGRDPLAELKKDRARPGAAGPVLRPRLPARLRPPLQRRPELASTPTRRACATGRPTCATSRPPCAGR